MIHGILNVGQSIELEKLRSLREFCAFRIQEQFECTQFLPQFFVILWCSGVVRVNREDCEVNMQVEL